MQKKEKRVVHYAQVVVAKLYGSVLSGAEPWGWHRVENG